jgi:hypothetical protein
LNMPEDELFDPASPGPPRPEPQQGDIEVIRAMLAAIQASDRQFGGDGVRDQAATYLSQVIEPRLRARAPDRLRRPLFAVSTEFTLRVSAMHLDTGRPTVALELLGRAAGLASESLDLTLTAWVLARRGEYEIDQAALTKATGSRRPVSHIGEALAYTEGAAAVARSVPPRSQAFLRTKEALAVSLTGDRARTQRVLGGVWAVFEKAGTAEEPAWMGSYGAGHIHHEAGRCYVNLGMGPSAVRSAQAALAVRPGGRPRAFSLGIMAMGHALANEIEQACLLGLELISLAKTISSARVITRITELLETLKPHSKEPVVRELREAARPLLSGSER